MQLHATRDRAPYDGWSREGYTADAPDKFLTVSPGRSVDYELIVRRVMELDKRFRIKGIAFDRWRIDVLMRSEEHTSELQSLMRISYAVFCLKKKKQKSKDHTTINEYKAKQIQRKR